MKKNGSQGLKEMKMGGTKMAKLEAFKMVNQRTECLKPIFRRRSSY